MKLTLLAAVLAVSLVSMAQQSPEPAQSASANQNLHDRDTSEGSCLICRRCPNSSAGTETGDSCLLCRACFATADRTGAVVGPIAAESQQTYQLGVAQPPATNMNTSIAVTAGTSPFHQPTTASPVVTSTKTTTSEEWRTHSGAIDLHYEVGAVFHGPTIAACDINTGLCADSGRTHIAGNLGASYWIKPSLGLSLETVLMDGGNIAGTTQNAIGAYLGLQFQRSRGSIRPYVEVAPGYIHSFATGNTSSAFTEINPDVASVRAGGGFRFLIGKRWGLKVGVAALPSFNGIAHDTFVTATSGLFWQSKGKTGAE